jgi:hypothetical protein
VVARGAADLSFDEGSKHAVGGRNPSSSGGAAYGVRVNALGPAQVKRECLTILPASAEKNAAFYVAVLLSIGFSLSEVADTAVFVASGN